MTDKEKNLSLGRNVKIGMFHIGSGMADVLATGVWNRIMISDLGVSATPVSLLVSLRYFLAPLGIWAGRMSDERTVLGFRRLFWIWFGRFLMASSVFGLGLATSQLASTLDTTNAGLWIIIVLSMLLFSFGNALSGTTFLALIYDRSSEAQRGRAVGVVWTMLLLGFTIGGVVFSKMLPASEDNSTLSFIPQDLFTLFIVAGILFSAIWFFSILGEERRQDETLINDDAAAAKPSLRADLSLVWKNPAMRYFLFYLTLSMFFAFSQDPVLEPFAGDVFEMDASITNRFASYWGGTAIVGSVFFLWLSRRIKRFTNTIMSQVGVSVLVLAFAMLTLAALLEIRALMTPTLLVLGVGLGMWNIGTLGLMMDLSPLGRAGTFLGFWSMSVTLARGGGIAAGGIVRDIGLQLSGEFSTAYTLVFGGAIIGLLISAWCLSRVQVQHYEEQTVATQELADAVVATLD